MIYDVIVIGMGPAGSTAAFEAASKGLSVLALDKASFPRYKTCGGGLTPKILSLLNIENLSCLESVITSLRLSFGSRKKTFRFNRPVAYMVMRERFDQMLVDRAVKAGVEFNFGQKVSHILEQKEWIEVHAGPALFRGRVAVGSDGGLGISTQWLNPGLRIKKAPGMEGEFPRNHDPVDISTIEIDVCCVKSGYGWIFPKKEVLSIGVAGFTGNPAIKTDYRHYVQDSFPRPPSGATASIPRPLAETGHPLPVFGNRKLTLCSKRMILAGDAGHLIDPFFGEGIYYAMRSGQLAAEAAKKFISGEDLLSEYQKAIETEFYPEFRGAQRLARLVYRFPNLWFDLALRHPGVIDLYNEVLSGRRSYRNFLSTVLKKGLRRLFTQ